MIGKTLSHYRVLEKIGAGGMGEVYRAWDEHLARDVAIKVLRAGTLADEAARRRFRTEAQALSKLNHPSIETVHDFDTQEGVDFLVMEFVPGVSLDERLAAESLPQKEITRLGTQLAEALAAAHEQGVVHRDLKPGNLRVTPDGRLKVLDFGLAKLLQPETQMAPTKSVTETRAMAGTLPYMPPEQLRAEKVDARSDIWAAGAVLYEMASGQRPFREEVAVRLVDAILHQAPIPPRTVNGRISPELERIILKCLEKDPENRYQSAKELGVDLRRLGMPTTATAIPSRPPRARRWSLAVLGALAALLAVLVGLNVGEFRDGVWSRVSGRAKPARIESLAVLPLENLARDPSQDYFADGMTEA
ncbi:MAG: protein kinase, partial [Acidobacteria bacterium]|nr:protein kinase [Acidobacteriota bacterium]